MTLEQLRIFVAVAEREHVTRASEALHLSQSAVSAALAAIEGRHATRLFDRVGRGVALTEAGRLFLDEARAVLARAQGAEQVLADLSGLRRGSLALTASQTIAGHWLPRHLVAFRRAYPEIAVRLTLGNTAQTARAVREGVAELGFVEGAVEEPLLSAETVGHDALRLVARPGHALVAGPVTSDTLAAADWVLREPGSGTRSACLAALAGAGLPPERVRIALELPSNEAVRSAVEAGAGASVLSDSVVAPSLQAGLLARAEVALPRRDFRVLRHRERYRSRAAEALLDLIREETGPDGLE